MARRSILTSAALVAILLVATVPQSAVASVRHTTHEPFCAKARGQFFGDDIHVGQSVGVNATAFNCSAQREHVPTTWRIWGPCHPDVDGSKVFVLRQSEGVIVIFQFHYIIVRPFANGSAWQSDSIVACP